MQPRYIALAIALIGSTVGFSAFASSPLNNPSAYQGLSPNAPVTSVVDMSTMGETVKTNRSMAASVYNGGQGNAYGVTGAPSSSGTQGSQPFLNGQPGANGGALGGVLGGVVQNGGSMGGTMGGSGSSDGSGGILGGTGINMGTVANVGQMVGGAIGGKAGAIAIGLGGAVGTYNTCGGIMEGDVTLACGMNIATSATAIYAATHPDSQAAQTAARTLGVVNGSGIVQQVTGIQSDRIIGESAEEYAARKQLASTQAWAMQQPTTQLSSAQFPQLEGEDNAHYQARMQELLSTSQLTTTANTSVSSVGSGGIQVDSDGLLSSTKYPQLAGEDTAHYQARMEELVAQSNPTAAQMQVDSDGLLSHPQLPQLPGESTANYQARMEAMMPSSTPSTTTPTTTSTASTTTVKPATTTTTVKPATTTTVATKPMPTTTDAWSVPQATSTMATPSTTTVTSTANQALMQQQSDAIVAAQANQRQAIATYGADSQQAKSATMAVNGLVQAYSPAGTTATKPAVLTTQQIDSQLKNMDPWAFSQPTPTTK